MHRTYSLISYSCGWTENRKHIAASTDHRKYSNTEKADKVNKREYIAISGSRSCRNNWFFQCADVGGSIFVICQFIYHIFIFIIYIVLWWLLCWPSPATTYWTVTKFSRFLDSLWQCDKLKKFVLVLYATQGIFPESYNGYGKFAHGEWILYFLSLSPVATSRR